MSASNAPQTLPEAARTFFRYPSPRFLTGLVGMLVAARVVLGDWSVWDAVVAAGLLAFWPVQEWLIHVFILHARPIRLGGRTFDHIAARKHRAHHGDPGNLEILFIPVQGFVVGIPFLLVFWIGLTPAVALAFSGLAIYFVLTLHYEWIHFLIHSRYRPRTRYYERRWRNHLLHHFKNEHYWYGVTALGGDRLFRTSPAASEVEISPTCRGMESQMGVSTR